MSSTTSGLIKIGKRIKITERTQDMRQNIAILLLLVMTATRAWGWSNNDAFTVDGITYNIHSASKYTVEARFINNVSVDEKGKAIIPARVKDPKDSEKYFTVEQLYLSSCPDRVKILELEEGSVSVTAQPLGISLDEIILPKNVTRIIAGAGNIRKFTFREGSPFRVGDDGEVYTYTGKSLIYHIRGNKITDGVYKIKEGVDSIIGSLYDPKITSIKFSSTVKYYGDMGLDTDTKQITVAEGNTTFKATDGVLYSYDGTTLYRFPPGKDVGGKFTIPADVTTVGTNAFYSCRCIEIDLNNISKLNASAISSDSLTTLGIGKNLASLYGVNTLKSLTTINIHKDNPHMQSIDGVVFNKEVTDTWNYTYSTLIKYPGARTGAYTLPEGVKKIADEAFRGVSQLSLEGNANLETIGDQAFLDASINALDFSKCTNLKTFGSYAFKGVTFNMKEFVVPASLETAYAGWLFYCYGLTTITIPAGSKLKTLSESAFYNIFTLTTVTIDPNCSLETIGAHAFRGSNKLTSLSLPKTVTTIGKSAFKGCKALKSVTFAKDADIKTIGDNAFEFSGITTITIPEGVTTIGKEAFSTCDVLTEVTLPSTLQSFSGEAFKFCSKLENVHVADGNQNYSSVNGILLNKDKTTLVLFPPAKANDKFTLLPPSIEKLGDYAFYTCTNLKNVVIPNKVTSIGERTFGMCDNLNSITFLCDNMIPSANINQEQNKVAFDATMFANIDIHVRKDLLSEYQNEDFYNKFNSITPSVESGTEEYIAVSDNAVSLLSTSATNEKSTFKVPSSVKVDGKDYTVSMIGDYCFQNAPAKMNEVVVSENVEYIGAKAFINNAATIKNIFFLPTTASSNVLSTKQFELTSDYNEFASDQNIYVKQSVVDAYKAAWADYASQIKYQIPFQSDNSTPVIATRFGTFSREFDVDISDNNPMTASGKPAVVAYTGMIEKVTNDEGTFIRMSSINCGKGTDIDGKYIPANTGVLLEGNCYNSEKGVSQSPADFTYYKIGEREITAPADNIMECVTETSRTIKGKEDGYYNYIISQGKYWSLGDNQEVEIPAHKSYMHVPASAGSKRIVMVFGDMADDPTFVSSPLNGSAAPAPDVLYDLTGRRVNGIASPGLYIVNGRKYVRK